MIGVGLRAEMLSQTFFSRDETLVSVGGYLKMVI